MDCCQLEQDIPPTVKREVLLDDNDRKSPDQDSSGKNKKSKKFNYFSA